MKRPTTSTQTPSQMLLLRLEQFIQQENFLEAEELIDTLLDSFSEYDNGEKYRFLDCAHSLANNFLQEGNVPAAEKIYSNEKLTRIIQENHPSSSPIIFTQFHKKIGTLFSQYNCFDLSLNHFTKSLRCAQEHELDDLIDTLQANLDKLEIDYLYHETVMRFTHLLREQDNSTLPFDKVKELLQQINPIVSGLISQEQWEKVEQLYKLLEPVTERFLTSIEAQLSVAKQKDLASFEDLAREIDTHAEQFLMHRQYKTSLSCYQWISKHAEKEAANFNKSWVLERMAQIYDYRERQDSPSAATYTSKRIHYQQELSNCRTNLKLALSSPGDFQKKQDQFQEEVKEFLIEIGNDCDKLLGPAPCGFALMGLGSFASGVLAPYSDIDCAFLIADDGFRNHLYFQQWIRIFKFKLDTLGENDLPGLHIDSGDMTHFIDCETIDTPTGYSKRYDPETVDASQPEPYAIHRPALIFSNEDGANLIDDYQKRLRKQFEAAQSNENEPLKAVHQNLAYKYLLDHQEKFQGNSKWQTRNNVIDIKNGFLRPILFWCRETALYYGIFKTNIYEILEELRTGTHLHPYFIDELRNAINYLLQIRAHHHLQFGKQADTYSIEKQDDNKRSTLAEPEQKNLRNIEELVLNVIYTDVEVWKTKTVLSPLFNPVTHHFRQQLLFYHASTNTPTPLLKAAIKNILLFLTKTKADKSKYLDFYKELPGQLRKMFLRYFSEIETDSNQFDSTYNHLTLFPEPNGSRIFTQAKQTAWQQQLQHFLSTADKSTSPRKVPFKIQGRGIPQQALTEELETALFQENGEFKEKSLSGQHTVIPVDLSNARFHCKLYPEFPGIEFAVHRLHELIIGHGTAASELMKLTSNNRITPVLVSETIEGHPLHRASEIHGWQQKLDHKRLSQLILMKILCHPEDEKPDNLILETNPDQNDNTSYHLTGVDNDHAFVPSATKEGLLGGFRVRLLVKTILFCFDSMNEPLHPEAIEEFLILKPGQVLISWLDDLMVWENTMREVFTEQETFELSNSKKDNEKTLTPILLRQGLVGELFETMHLMQSWLRQHAEKPAIELLKYIDPLLANYYSKLLSDDSLTPNKRFYAITASEYKVIRDGSSVTQVNTLQTMKSMLGRIPSLNTAQSCETFSPEHAHKEMLAIQRQQSTLEAVKDAVMSGDLLAYKALIISEFKERIINTIDFGSLPTSDDSNNSTEQMLLQSIEGHSFRQLVFRNSQLLDSNILTALKKDSPSLISIAFIYCPRIDNNTLKILRDFAFLEMIRIEGYAFSRLDFTTNIIKQTLFPSLKKLTLTNCETLSTFSLKSHSLKKLAFKNCPKLSKLKLNAPSLEKLSIEDCDLITDKSLAASTHQCDNLKLVTLRNCPNITHQSLKEKVPHLIRFEIFDESFWSLLNDIGFNRIKEVDLSNQSIAGDKCRALCAALAHNTTVEVLNLENTSIDTAGFEKLCEALSNHPTIEKLNLSRNRLKDSHMTAISTNLKSNPSLQWLDLSYNQIKSTGASKLALALQENSTLTHMNLLGNDVGSDGAMSFVRALKHNQTIQTLTLLQVGIDGSIMDLIRDSLSYNQKITGTPSPDKATEKPITKSSADSTVGFWSERSNGRENATTTKSGSAITPPSPP